jgi:hypothetical protein
MLILAVAVCSKDGDFNDSLKTFTGDDASKQAALWFREGIAQSMRTSWSVHASDETNALADRIEAAETIEEVAQLASEAYEAADEHEESAFDEYWEFTVLTETLEV